ncbi:MAG: hypothetical protein Q7S64_02860 [bacterium]|nr:hypothetical protein [bacterium]
MDTIVHLLILVLHALAAMLIVGSIAVALMIMSNKKVEWANLVLLKQIWRWLTPLIGIQIITGLYLMINEWEEFGHSGLLWFKLALLAFDGLVSAAAIKRYLAATGNNLNDKPTTVSLQPINKYGWLTLLTFLLISTIGVLLAA